MRRHLARRAAIGGGGLNAETQGALAIALGVITVRLVLTDGFLWFVQSRMRWPLLLSGVGLILLGGATVARAWRAGRADPAGHDHDHRHNQAHEQAQDGGGHEERESDIHAGHSHAPGAAPRIAWLLAAPIVVILLVAPTPLGSYAATRGQALEPARVTFGFPPLPEPAAGAVPMGIYDFLQRALWDSDRSLEGVPVRLIGFVVNDPVRAPDGFLLTRFMLACCAADALPMQVVVEGFDAGRFDNDTWVEVEGRWVPAPLGDEQRTDGPPVVALDASSATPVERPTNPYE